MSLVGQSLKVLFKKFGSVIYFTYLCKTLKQKIMLTLLIGILLPIVIYLLIGLFLFIFKRNKISDYFSEDNFGVTGALTVVTFIIALIVALSLPYKNHSVHITYQLESLEDGNSTKSRLFLGCGMVNNRMIYSFYYKDKGYYKLEQLEIYNTKIKYSNNPRFIVCKLVEDDIWYNEFVIGLNDECRRYVLCVPRGTIKNNYYLDTK